MFWSRNVPMDISGTNKQRMRGYRQPTRGYGRYRRSNPGRTALRKVNRIEKVLKKGENKKSKTTTLSDVVLASGTPSTSSMVTMQRGDTNYLREGDKITLKEITWRLQFQLNNAETDGVGVRFVIVYDRRPAGAQATWTHVFNPNTINGLMNLTEENRGRFQIIHDQIWQLAPNGNEIAMEKGYKSLKNLPVWYDANVGDITDVQKGNLFAALISDNNASNVLANGAIRIRFVDDN